MGEGVLKRIRVACIQMNAGAAWPENLAASLELAREAVRRKVRVLALPENFLWRGAASELGKISREAARQALLLFSRFAVRHRVHCLLGSLPEPSRIPGKFFNTSYLLSDRGAIAAKYRKRHLFEIALPRLHVREQDRFLPGRGTGFARVLGLASGLSICFDLRFPEHYRRLRRRGARLFFVPSNFTYATGQDHWETLLRARAIENQAFVLAPAQWGVHPDSGIRSFGHTRIIDPWGKILARLGSQGSGLAVADLDLREQDLLRQRFPCNFERGRP